jgi:hypothetical protein
VQPVSARPHALVRQTTRFFQDVVIFPLLFRALFGENLEQLSAQINPHVTRSVVFFLAACRHGGFN